MSLDDSIGTTTRSLSRTAEFLSTHEKSISKKIIVRIIQGFNLLSADENGFSDPFIKIRGCDTNTQKTKVIKKNLNPYWNQSFEVNVGSHLKLEVLDKDVLKDDKIGRLSLRVQGPFIDVRPPFPLKGVEIVQRFKLAECATGEIELGLTAIGEDWDDARKKEARERKRLKKQGKANGLWASCTEFSTDFFKEEPKKKEKKSKKSKDKDSKIKKEKKPKPKTVTPPQPTSKKEELEEKKTNESSSSKFSFDKCNNHVSYGKLKDLYDELQQERKEGKTVNESKFIIENAEQLLHFCISEGFLTNILDLFPFNLQKFTTTDLSSGTLSSEIYQEIFNKPDLKDKICKVLMALFDRNGDGKIDFNEVLTGFAVLSEGDAKDRAELQFRVADKDGNGVLSHSEVEAMVKVRIKLIKASFVVNITAKTPQLKLLGFTDEQIESFPDKVLSNIDFQKFVDFTLSKIYHYADADSDGSITFDEYVDWYSNPVERGKFTQELVNAIAQLQECSAQEITKLLKSMASA